MDDPDKPPPIDTPHHIRLKLDKRIHNQRKALRDDWQIVEQRRKSNHSFMRDIFRRVHRLMDRCNIPKGRDTGSHYSIHYRLKLLEDRLSEIFDSEQKGES